MGHLKQKFESFDVIIPYEKMEYTIYDKPEDMGPYQPPESKEYHEIENKYEYHFKGEYNWESFIENIQDDYRLYEDILRSMNKFRSDEENDKYVMSANFVLYVFKHAQNIVNQHLDYYKDWLKEEAQMALEREKQEEFDEDDGYDW